MGFMNRLMGNAVRENPEKIAKQLLSIMIENEQIIMAFKLVRDQIVFTNFRLILINAQGLTGKKKEYHTIPYSKITHFSVESAGTFDMDSDLKIWVSSMKEPIELKFKKGGKGFLDIQRVLAHYVLK